MIGKRASIKDELIKKVQIFEKSPLVFLVRKSKLTILIIFSLIIFGLVTIKNLPKELNPEVEIPIAIIATVYPGASPLDVEEQVTKKIENEVSNITGIKRMDSNSALGYSSIVVEFNAGEDLKDSISELKDKVDRVKNSLPENAMSPEVVEININNQPVIEATLTSDSYDIASLKDYAENIKDRVKSIPYVSDVVIVGGRNRVVNVDFDPYKLQNFGLTLSEVLNKLSANHINFPLGSIEIEDSRYSIRIEGKFDEVFQLASFPIGLINNKVIYLEDVAKVEEGFSNEYNRSRFSIGGLAPTDAVSLQIYKKTGGDIMALALDSKKRIEDGRGSLYPEDVQIRITNDTSKYVSDSISTLTQNGLATVILILILLFLFLGVREASLAGPAVPFSFFIAFIAMSFVGESINNISLFALVLSLGLLVDSAIVVVEGIYNKVSRYGLNGYQAAISTIEEYAGPLFSGMMTTVAAFFPLLFVEGIFGQFIKSIPTVVIITLFAGLFVSLSIIPALAVYLINPVNDEDKRKKENFKKNKFFSFIQSFFLGKLKSKPRKERFASRIFEKMTTFYCANIPKLIEKRRNRMIITFGSWILFFVSMALPIFGFLKVQSFGNEDSEFFYINLEMPSGTVLDKTDQTARIIEEELQKNPYIDNFVTNIGASIGSDGSSGGGGERSSNTAFFQVNLISEKQRSVLSMEIVSDFRNEFNDKITQGKVSFVEAQAGPPAGSPVEVRVVGDDLLILEELADQIKTKISTIPTVIELETSIDNSPGEIVFVPNKELLNQQGLSVIQIASELRSGISVNDNLEISKNGEELKIEANFDDFVISNFDDIKDLKLIGLTGQVFALSELGEIKFTSSLSSVKRRDSERVVTISGKTEGGNVAQINEEVKTKLKDLSLPSGYQIVYGGEAQELQEVYMDMLFKMILGIIMILFILVLQFNSYKQTLIILFTIPLAMIGVFWGMTIFRLTLDIPAFIGIVSLAGIVVNNAIILIDQINRELKEGEDLVIAAKNAGCIRMRPIFLTTITTVAGLLPLSISEPIWRNLGFAVIFGLVFSTLLTLVVVPVMYVSLYGDKFEKNNYKK